MVQYSVVQNNSPLTRLAFYTFSAPIQNGFFLPPLYIVPLLGTWFSPPISYGSLWNHISPRYKMALFHPSFPPLCGPVRRSVLSPWHSVSPFKMTLSTFSALADTKWPSLPYHFPSMWPCLTLDSFPNTKWPSLALYSPPMTLLARRISPWHSLRRGLAVPWA